MFQSGSDAFVDNKVMYADAAVCQVAINANDNRFWTQSAQDGYYKCSSEICGSYSAPTWTPQLPEIKSIT